MKKIYTICLVLLIILLTSACNSNKEVISQHNSNNLSVSEEKLKPGSDSSKSVLAIKQVLINQKEFICTENEKSVLLKDFDCQNYLYLSDDKQFEYTKDNQTAINKFTRFCQFDIDNDGINEVLLESKTSNILLLDYDDNTVNGYVFSYRSVLNLKKDGSFNTSGGAVTNYIGTLYISDGKCKYIELCCYDEYDLKNPYRINNKKADKDAVNAYFNTYAKKENAEWFDFSELNIKNISSKIELNITENDAVKIITEFIGDDVVDDKLIIECEGKIDIDNVEYYTIHAYSLSSLPTESEVIQMTFTYGWYSVNKATGKAYKNETGIGGKLIPMNQLSISCK